MSVKADLHFHSVLSACADSDNTVCNLAGMCAVNGVQIAALADHNSVKNGRAFSKACAEYGICVVPAAEITTEEEIHVLCLFPDFSSAETFCGEAYEKLPKFPVNRAFYNEQKILDCNDSQIGSEPYLLSVACGMNIYEVCAKVKALGGIAVPAHIDRDSYSILSVLGSIPDDLGITAVEFSLSASEKFKEEYFDKYNCIVSSDAHDLESLCKNNFSIDLDEVSVVGLIGKLSEKIG